MKRKRDSSSKIIADRTSKGQTFIIIAVAFLVLVAFVGLAVDAGLAFIAYGKLARAADAAALSAAAQFREGRSIDEMSATAENAMAVNGVDFSNITVEVCDYSLSLEDQDPQLCPQPIRKKYVRVTVWADIPMAFLRVLGFDEVGLSAMSIAEAASVDVVLVIDISESMAWDAASGDPLRDPSVCNDTSIYDGSEDGAYPNFPNGLPGECHPFEEVKNAAGEFVARVLDKTSAEEEDRLSIVTFGNGWSANQDMGTFIRSSGWTNDASTALSIVENLKIVEPDPCFYEDGSINQEYGPCIFYDPPDSTSFNGVYCISCTESYSDDPSYLPTTNIGGGLKLAGNMFSLETREDALWVVILLTDGMANATMADEDGTDDIFDFSTYPVGNCPNDWTFPLCQDEDISTRHDAGSGSFDADDYARDMADFVGCPSENGQGSCAATSGQAAVIFTVGLGNGVLDTTNEANSLPYGTALLRYIAAVGDDTDPTTDPCDEFWDDQDEWQEWCGNYYFSPEGDQLVTVFQDIASRVFTRLAR
jgi:hypothetical protein